MKTTNLNYELSIYKHKLNDKKRNFINQEKNINLMFNDIKGFISDLYK